MADPDDQYWVAQAGEYVLGTLDQNERAEFEQHLGAYPALADEVARWQMTLVPLVDAVPLRAVPDHITHAILRQAAASAAPGQNTAAPGQNTAAIVATRRTSRSAKSNTAVRLQRHVRRWQLATAVSTGMAAAAVGFAVFVMLQPNVPTSPSNQPALVAVLAGDDKTPAYVAAVDVVAGTISIRRLVSDVEVGKAHELWVIGGGRAQPESLGVMTKRQDIDRRIIEAITDDAADKESDVGLTFAISVEPEGGSPTGQPTGPVVFTGKLVPTP